MRLQCPAKGVQAELSSTRSLANASIVLSVRISILPRTLVYRMKLAPQTRTSVLLVLLDTLSIMPRTSVSLARVQPVTSWTMLLGFARNVALGISITRRLENVKPLSALEDSWIRVLRNVKIVQQEPIPIRLGSLAFPALLEPSIVQLKMVAWDAQMALTSTKTLSLAINVLRAQLTIPRQRSAFWSRALLTSTTVWPRRNVKSFRLARLVNSSIWLLKSASLTRHAGQTRSSIRLQSNASCFRHARRTISTTGIPASASSQPSWPRRPPRTWSTLTTSPNTRSNMMPESWRTLTQKTALARPLT